MKLKSILLLIVALVAITAAVKVARSQGVAHGTLRLIHHTYDDLGVMAMPMPNVKDGHMVYCDDCTAPATPGAKCAKGGPGAEAHHIRGQWVCF